MQGSVPPGQHDLNSTSGSEFIFIYLSCEAYGPAKRFPSAQGCSPKMNHTDVALTNRHEQEHQAVVGHRRVEAPLGCTHFELSNASGFPPWIGFPAFRLRAVTVTHDCHFCCKAGKLSWEHAAAGEIKMSELPVWAVAHTVTDTEAIGWHAVDDLEHERFHLNYFSSGAFAAT
jgi:hypothetical protein